MNRDLSITAISGVIESKAINGNIEITKNKLIITGYLFNLVFHILILIKSSINAFRLFSIIY